MNTRMEWAVRVFREKEDPFTHHISKSSRNYYYKTEKGARDFLKRVSESDQSVVRCRIYKEVPGSYEQEQLFGPQSSLWDF